MSDFASEMIGTPEGMTMFLVGFELSYKGVVCEEENAYVNVETLDLEEVFYTVQTDMAIQFQIEDFVNENYGQLEFDAWRPVIIQQWFLDENGIVKRDIEPPVVWKDGDGGIKLH